MPIPILATKLYIPPVRTGVVPRARLIERLNEVLQRKLALISAPAGFGKTTLVSEWVASFGKPVAWLSLDEVDSDPTRFITYLIAALQTIAPDIGKRALAAIQSPQLPPAETILISLLNDVAALPDSFILTLDDYHLIDSDPIDRALTFLLDHMPPQMHLVIATREDPSLPLPRYRVRGYLTELRATDLRFTLAEAADFLNRIMGLNLSEGDIAVLDKRTEGWIAGLQLAALSMKDREDITCFIQAFTGSHRYVLDYLIEEVLQRQSEHVRGFLMRTAILDRLCAPLCNVVTEQEDGKDLLDILERSNLFLMPLDDQRQWYRYHHLFAEVLQVRLTDAKPDLVPALHKRASIWYEHNGLAADAIYHALAAKDFERAAALIELAVPEMRRNRQGATVTELGWLKALPGDLVRLRPVLCVAYAYASFGGGELEYVEAWLRDAERWLEPADMGERPESARAGMVVVDEREFRRLPGMIALMRTAQALARGDMPETVKNARRVLDLAPADDYLMLGGAASTLGLAAWANGDLNAACRMIADGMTNVRRAGYITPAIGDAITLADIQIAKGCLRDAMNTYEQALQWAMGPGMPVLRGAADMHVGMSSLFYEHNDLGAATQHLLTSQALGELAGLPQNPYRWCAAMARIRESQGDLGGALDLLDQAERLYVANFSPNVRPIAARKARVWVSQGNLDKALGWARAQGLSVENELSYLREFDHMTLARVLLACYQSDHEDHFLLEAMGLLERLLKAAEEGGRTGSLIEILMLQALAHHAQGDTPAALIPLRRALALAEPEGYVRIFVDEGQAMAQLLAVVRRLSEADSAGINSRQGLPTYTGMLLAAMDAEKQKGENRPGPVPNQILNQPEAQTAKTVLFEPLSQRELKILQLIAQGLSNRQIGERLFIALDTVKGHNRNIFDKLQVQSRTEAIARARELGLL